MVITRDRFLDTRDRFLDTRGRFLDTRDRLMDTRGRFLDTRDRLLDTVKAWPQEHEVKNIAPTWGGGGYDLVLPCWL